MRKLVIVLFIAAGIAAMNACKQKDEEPVYTPVVYTIPVPDFVKTYVGVIPQPADNIATVDGIALGRKLFYEKMLSNDNTISCASCHKQENYNVYNCSACEAGEHPA